MVLMEIKPDKGLHIWDKTVLLDIFCYEYYLKLKLYKKISVKLERNS